MSAGIRPLPYRKVARALESLGFQVVRQTGSHVFFRHPDGRTTLVLNHPGGDLGRGLIRAIIRDTRLPPQEFLRLV